MNLKLLVATAMLWGSVAALAQDAGGPPPRGEGVGVGPGGRDMRGGGPRGGGGGFDGPPGERMPGDRPLPGGPGQGRPGQGNALAAQVDLMRNWLDLIDRYSRMSKDPVSAAVAAVVSADDLMRNKPEQAAEFFTKMLDQTKNETVQRAIRLQLVEIYGRQGKPEKAIEHLQKLITAPAAGAEQK